MDLFEAIYARTSIRSFKKEIVPKELLEQIVDAGRHAPSAINIQPWEFVVCTDDEKIQDIAGVTDYGKFIAQASACIAVICEDTKYYLEDGCAAVENMLLAATALGLGACWVAGDKKSYCSAVKQILQIPDHFKLVALLPIGFPKYDKEPNSKRPLDQVLHWEKF